MADHSMANPKIAYTLGGGLAYISDMSATRRRVLIVFFSSEIVSNIMLAGPPPERYISNNFVRNTVPVFVLRIRGPR